VTPPPAASGAYAGPAPVAPQSPAAPAPGPGEPPAAPVLGARPSRGRNRVLLAVGAVVALVVVVGGALVIAGGGDDTSAPASDEAPSDESGETDEPSASDTSDADSGSGGGDETEPDAPAPADATATPEAAAEALFAAARAGDCETLIGLLAPEAFGTVDPAAAIAECEADAGGRASMAELEIVDVSLVSETGDQAVVAVTAMVDGEPSTEELPLRRVDGAWLVVSLE